jgi:hypothetical protein
VSASAGLIVRLFVPAVKLMKLGKKDQPCKTIELIIGLHDASTIGYD